jgi:hypothetical protein
MKRVLSLLPLVLLCGCSSTNITDLTKALAKDPAIVIVKVGSVYGTLSFVRVGSQTNGVTVSPDGSVSIK